MRRPRKPRRVARDDNPDASFYELMERYPDEAAAARYFEARRWPDGVACPGCKSKDVVRLKVKRQHPLWACHGCGEQFSITSGTIMEATKLPLKKWLMAFHFIGASKKGISTLQLKRMLKVTYETAWHLGHRIRATMVPEAEVFSGTVETDEAYIGGKRKHVGKGYRGNKLAVQTIVQRGDGDHGSRARTMALNNGHKVDGRAVGAKLRTHTDPDNTILMTDDSNVYDAVGKSYKEHHSVNHKQEVYVTHAKDGCLVTTNAAEGLFANLKRQINGTHHHTSKKHLPKYLTEFDYKYNSRDVSDGARTEAAIKNMEGKRLTLYKVRGLPSLYDKQEPR